MTPAPTGRRRCILPCFTTEYTETSSTCSCLEHRRPNGGRVDGPPFRGPASGYEVRQRSTHTPAAPSGHGRGDHLRPLAPPLLGPVWPPRRTRALLLIAAGADVTLRFGNLKMAPLNVAASFNQVEVIKELARHGIDLDAAFKYTGCTALQQAAWEKHVGAVGALVEAGASVA